MVHASDLATSGFTVIEQYYDYITESMGNGQRNQVGELFLKLSKDQRKGYLTILTNAVGNERDLLALSTLRYCISLIY